MAATVVTAKASSKKLKVIGSRYFHDTQQVIAGNPAINYNGNKLCNTFGYPMLLDEIRFEASAIGPGGLLVPVSPVALSARISAAKHKLHNTMTPILLTCKPNDRVYGALPGAPSAWALPTAGATGTIEVGAVSWRLDKPLTLMPHDTLDVAVQYPPLSPALGAADAGTPYTVTVTGIGRLVEEAPARRWVPFVSAWIPPYASALSIANKPTVIRSLAAQLFNPFNLPFFVKDVLGLGTVYDTTGTVAAVQNINDTAYLGFATEGCNVQVINAGAMANGESPISNVGIRDYVPFYHAFEPTTRSWRMNAVLQPRSYLQARFQQQNWRSLVSSINSATDASTIYARFAMAIVGYAQEG